MPLFAGQPTSPAPCRKSITGYFFIALSGFRKLLGNLILKAMGVPLKLIKYCLNELTSMLELPTETPLVGVDTHFCRLGSAGFGFCAEPSGWVLSYRMIGSE